MKRSTFAVLFILFFALTLTACQSKSASATVPENFQEISQPMAENLFTSIENDDYESFHKDFAKKMLAATSEESYQTIRDNILQTVGDYQSLTYEQTVYEEGYFTSYFQVTFSKGTLTLRLVLDAEEPYQIEGFWFPDFPAQ